MIIALHSGVDNCRIPREIPRLISPIPCFEVTYQRISWFIFISGRMPKVPDNVRFSYCIPARCIIFRIDVKVLQINGKWANSFTQGMNFPGIENIPDRCEHSGTLLEIPQNWLCWNPLKSIKQIRLFRYFVTLPGLRPAAVATPIGIGDKLQVSDIFLNAPIEPC
jgi:hypothetical protein